RPSSNPGSFNKEAAEDTKPRAERKNRQETLKDANSDAIRDRHLADVSGAGSKAQERDDGLLSLRVLCELCVKTKFLRPRYGPVADWPYYWSDRVRALPPCGVRGLEGAALG